MKSCFGNGILAGSRSLVGSKGAIDGSGLDVIVIRQRACRLDRGFPNGCDKPCRGEDTPKLNLHFHCYRALYHSRISHDLVGFAIHEGFPGDWNPVAHQQQRRQDGLKVASDLDDDELPKFRIVGWCQYVVSILLDNIAILV